MLPPKGPHKPLGEPGACVPAWPPLALPSLLSRLGAVPVLLLGLSVVSAADVAAHVVPLQWPLSPPCTSPAAKDSCTGAFPGQVFVYPFEEVVFAAERHLAS